MASLNDLLYDIRRIEENREVLTESKIRSMYRSLMDDLDAFLARGYKKYADSDGRLYVSYLDAQRKRAWFLNEIVKNVDSLSPTLQKQINTLINTTYKECYAGMVEALQKADQSGTLATVTSDLSVRPEVLKQAVNNNISKLTLPAVLEKHRGELIYQIQQELNIGLMNGDRYEKMARRISERLDVSYSKAMNITRTETHRNIESGFMDCAEHLSEGLEGSDYIYAATWRTMRDERVRPQQRVKTKKGWKTYTNKNGANHQQMEGVTVKVGEMFNLGNGVKAKAPSQSGVAAHDCNCRCFLEYNLMTVEEFAKASGMSVDAVRKKYNIKGEPQEVEETQATKFETLVDAEKYSQKFSDKVSFSGAKSMDDVSIVVNTLDRLTTKFPIKKLSTLNTNSRLKRAQARANYECLEIKTSMLSGKHEVLDWQKRMKDNEALLEKYKSEYLGNSKYNQNSVKKAIKQIEEERKYKRWTVSGGAVDKTIMHEYGHILADQYIGQINGRSANANFSYSGNNALYNACLRVKEAYQKAKRNGDIFNISMYASTNEHEFFAEIFTMYASGEKLPDYITEVIEGVLKGGIL